MVQFKASSTQPARGFNGLLRLSNGSRQFFGRWMLDVVRGWRFSGNATVTVCTNMRAFLTQVSTFASKFLLVDPRLLQILCIIFLQLRARLGETRFNSFHTFHISHKHWQEKKKKKHVRFPSSSNLWGPCSSTESFIIWWFKMAATFAFQPPVR